MRRLAFLLTICALSGCGEEEKSVVAPREAPPPPLSLPVADILPADALAVVYLPDAAGSLDRAAQTPIGRLLGAPSTKAQATLGLGLLATHLQTDPESRSYGEWLQGFVASSEDPLGSLWGRVRAQTEAYAGGGAAFAVTGMLFPEGTTPVLEAMAVLSAQDAGRLRKGIDGALDRLLDDEPSVKRSTAREGRFPYERLADGEVTVCHLFLGKAWVVTSTEALMKKTLRRIGSDGKIADAWSAHPAVAPALAGEAAPDVVGHVRVAALLSSLEPILPEQGVRFIEASGLAGFTDAVYALRLASDGARETVSLLAPSPRRGLLRLMDNEPVRREGIPWVPGRTVSVNVARVDVGRAWRVLREFLAAGDARGWAQAERGMHVAEAAVGASLEHDLLGAIDGEITLLELPEGRSALPTAAVLTLAEGNRLGILAERLAAFLDARQVPFLVMEREGNVDAGEPSILRFSVPLDAIPLPPDAAEGMAAFSTAMGGGPSLALCVRGNRCYLGPNAAVVRQAIAVHGGGVPSDRHAEAGAFLDALPAGTWAAGWNDLDAQAVRIVRLLEQLVPGSAAISLALAGGTGDSVYAWSMRTDDAGVHEEAVAPLPVLGLSGGVVFGAFFAAITTGF
ncbi:MAG: hypothetical protein HY608_11365 [Planctomycetes bacterium]|nr:hypothetical protein [Planctomycetota bacterium]